MAARTKPGGQLGLEARRARIVPYGLATSESRRPSLAAIAIAIAAGLVEQRYSLCNTFVKQPAHSAPKMPHLHRHARRAYTYLFDRPTKGALEWTKRASGLASSGVSGMETPWRLN